MTSQTDHHTEDTQFAELANRDEADAVSNRQQVEDAALYIVAALAGVVIALVIIFGN